jgi:tRNA dimethylallyltransferase
MLSGEIVSADSMKVYRGMDVGTAKPTEDVRRRVRHHLIDVLEPWESFSVGKYVQLADEAIKDIGGRGHVPIVSGGTPLYIKALVEGLFEGPSADWDLRHRLRAQAEAEGTAALHRRLGKVDPEAAVRIHENDLRRIVRALEVYEKTGEPISAQQQEFGRPEKRYGTLMVGIRRDRGDLYERIERRVDRMVAEGFEAEVRRLVSLERPLSREAKQALGYGEMIQWMRDGGDLDETIELIRRRTRQFAKRQLTWLRRFDDLVWISAGTETGPEEIAEEIVRHWQAGSEKPRDR